MPKALAKKPLWTGLLAVSSLVTGLFYPSLAYPQNSLCQPGFEQGTDAWGVSGCINVSYQCPPHGSWSVRAAKCDCLPQWPVWDDPSKQCYANASNSSPPNFNLGKDLTAEVGISSMEAIQAGCLSNQDIQDYFKAFASGTVSSGWGIQPVGSVTMDNINKNIEIIRERWMTKQRVTDPFTIGFRALTGPKELESLQRGELISKAQTRLAKEKDFKDFWKRNGPVVSSNISLVADVSNRGTPQVSRVADGLRVLATKNSDSPKSQFVSVALDFQTASSFASDGYVYSFRLNPYSPVLGLRDCQSGGELQYQVLGGTKINALKRARTTMPQVWESWDPDQKLWTGFEKPVPLRDELRRRGLDDGDIPAPTSVAPLPAAIPLWTTLPDGPYPTLPDEEIIENSAGVKAIRNVSEPRLIVHRPLASNGAAALVISGGGYFKVNVGQESEPTAKWLATLGFTAFELIYRLPKDTFGETRWTLSSDNLNQSSELRQLHWLNPSFVTSNYDWSDTYSPSVAPIQDALQAMTVIRKLAGTNGYTFDPTRIAVFGFSAGGHLAGMLGTGAAARLLGIQETPDSRPYFVALIYPVLFLKDGSDRHTQAFRHLLRDRPNIYPSGMVFRDGWDSRNLTTKMIEICAVERQVDASTPPMFLAQCSNDQISPIANIIQMDDALQKKGIPSKKYVFDNCPKRGHGWGLGEGWGSASAWPDLFIGWAEEKGFLTKKK